MTALLLGVGATTGALLPGAIPHAGAEPQFPAPPANGEMGFVVVAFSPAVNQGKDDCPLGQAGTVRENYLQSLPAPERERLLRKANEPELTERWKAYATGPNLTNICSNPELFDRPMQKILQGTVAPGLDLDGGKKSDTCQHENFTGLDGTSGVDNQTYRALGCTRNWRGIDGKAGDIVWGYNNALATGEHTQVLLLRGVQNLKDDDSVEVIWSNSDDRPVLDTKRKFITGASFTISENPRWRNALKGHIHNGVLTTEPQDIHLTHRLGHGGIRGQRSEWDLKRGRLRLTFQADGSLDGLAGAYIPPRMMIDSAILGGIGAATVAGIDCAAEITTLNRLADGIKDPKTGKCTAASAAMTVTAVSAFVNDRPKLARPGKAAR